MRINLGKLLAAAGLMLCANAGAHAAVYYVKPAGSDSNDGTTPTTAKATIQAAIKAASANDEVHVATGTYLLDSAIVLKEAVALKGGYDASLSTQNPALYPTTLDGQNQTRVIYQATNFSANTTIDGFTVQNGLQNDDNSQGAGAYLRTKITLLNCIFKNNAIVGRNAQGAGAYFSGANNTISGCTFDGNTITSTLWDRGISSAKGAGLYVEAGGNRVDLCTIKNNTITNAFANNSYNAMGGGLYSGSKNTISNCTVSGNKINDYGKGSSQGGGAYTLSQTVVTRCTIINNRIDKSTSDIASIAQGGGIHLNSSTLQSSSISQNTITYTTSDNNSTGTYNSGSNGGGGVYANFSCTLYQNSITQNSFSYNVALTGGGTLNANHVGGGGVLINATYGTIASNTLSNNNFTSNITGTGSINTKNGGGGGMYVTGTAVISIDSCTLLNNTASGGSLGRGGAMMLIAPEQQASITVISCNIRNNSAVDGGGIFAHNATIISSLIANNTATANGGGALLNNAETLIHCTIVRNTAPTGSSIYNTYTKLYGTAIWGNSGHSGNSSVFGTNYTGSYTAIMNTLISGTGNSSLSTNNTGDFNSPNFVLPTSISGKATNTADSTSVMAADWQITNTSPLKNAGVLVSSPEANLLPTFDFMHNPRICIRPDIGALEFNDGCSATPPTPPALPTITWATLSEIEYGATATLNATITSGKTISYLSSNSNIASISGSTLTTKSAGVVEIIARQNDNAKNFVSQTLIITPRTITVIADSKGKLQGVADPQLTYSIASGSLIGSDVFTGALSRDYGEAPGVYDIYQGTLALSSSYNLIFVSNYLVIEDGSAHGSQVYYVKPDGLGSNNGTSWDKAKNNIQAAIDVASKENPKAAVWVAAGTYTLSKPLQMVNGVNVYGGFVGNEGSLSERLIPAVGVTTGSGSSILNGNNVTQVLNQAAPFTTKTVWDGFTIINGHSDGNGGGAYLQNNSELRNCNIVQNHSGGMGGGVHCYKGCKVDNSYIAYNSADKEGGGAYTFQGEITNTAIDHNTSTASGGGVYAVYQSSINNCPITNNTATGNGGGAYGSSGATFVFCELNSNSAAGNGGGTYCDGNVALNSCTLNNNHANNGGGAHMREGSIADDCTVSHNTAQASGGGLYLYNGGMVTNTSVSNNHAAANGGGVFFSQKETGTLKKCTISSNNALQSGGGMYFDYGGTALSCGVYNNICNEHGGGVYFRSAGRCDSSTINNNQASNGGGIYSYKGGSASQNTIYNNTATESGGGAYLNATSSIAESTIYSNKAGKDGGGVYSASENKLYRNRIVNNSAAINGGGVYCDKNSYVVSSSVTNNSANSGGGIYSKTANNIISCTLARNSVTEYGGGIYYTSGSKMSNCIVWGNSSFVPQVFISGSSHSITYCAMESDTIRHDSIAGEGNIKLSYSNTEGTNPPRFRSTGSVIGASSNSAEISIALSANWRLSGINSACYNRGSNAAIPDGYYLDLANMPRVFNQTVDIGAYEWVPNGYTDIVAPKNSIETAKVYPNPTHGTITIGTSFTGNYLQVYSASGLLLYSAPLSGSEVDLSAMPNGTLFIRVTGQGKAAAAQVVKTR